jgi:nickel-type superoxide dismutase maturation protease
MASATVALLRTRRLIVIGNSMLPGLFPGDRVLVIPSRRIRPGDVVAVRAPANSNRLLVKRVGALNEPAGTVTVVGDNPLASTDSRNFGPVPRSAVVGRAVYRYGPPGREGWLRRVAPAVTDNHPPSGSIDLDG